MEKPDRQVQVDLKHDELNNCHVLTGSNFKKCYPVEYVFVRQSVVREGCCTNRFIFLSYPGGRVWALQAENSACGHMICCEDFFVALPSASSFLVAILCLCPWPWVAVLQD